MTANHDSLGPQLGALVGLAATAALLGTLPAMTRVSGALASGPPADQVRAWAALWAAAMGPMIGTIVLLRGAQRSLRAFGGRSAALRAFGVGLWFATLFITLTLFGTALRATTHHRALAGVTYGCGALVFAVGAGLICGRIVGMLQSASRTVRRVAVVVLSTAIFAAIALLVLRFLRVVSIDPSASEAAANVVDVLAFAFAALFASRDWRPLSSVLSFTGPPVAVFLAALGVRTLLDPTVYQALSAHAPAFEMAANLVSGRW